MKQLSQTRFSSQANKLAAGFYLLLLLVTSGCQIAPKDKPSVWPWKKDQTKPLPDRMLPVWTDTVLHQPNQPGVRGFGGRVYFYEKDKTDPIEIDGSLAVYVFDADDIDVNSQKPLRKFVFTADQFNEHMSKTSIGPSYSIWLPWGEVGGPPQRLSLIARFEGRDGGTTLSDPTIKLLPGVAQEDQGDESTVDSKLASKSPFRLSSHRKKDIAKSSNDEVTPEVKQEPNSDIKTIELPPSFQRHLRGTATETTRPVESKSNSSTNPVESEVVVEELQLPQTGDGAVAAPTTTQVYDYRTRRRTGASAFDAPKNDIRQGRWINSITRD
jgi:hypothetical protein